MSGNGVPGVGAFGFRGFGAQSDAGSDAAAAAAGVHVAPGEAAAPKAAGPQPPTGALAVAFVLEAVAVEPALAQGILEVVGGEADTTVSDFVAIPEKDRPTDPQGRPLAALCQSACPWLLAGPACGCPTIAQQS